MADLKLIAPATLGNSLSNIAPLGNLKADARSENSKKINKAAHDFESILIGQWLEGAQKSFATVPGGDPDAQADSGHDQFQSIAVQSLAQHLTKAGGFGIATMLIKQLQTTQPDGVDHSNKDSGAGGDHILPQRSTKLQK